MAGESSKQKISLLVCFILCSGFIGCTDDYTEPTPEFFTCDDGQLIHYENLEDGVPHCVDGSDESNLNYSESRCDEEKPVFQDERKQIVADYIYNFVPNSTNSDMGERTRDAFELHLTQNGSWNGYDYLSYEQRTVGTLADGICDFEILNIIDTEKCVLHAEEITIVQTKYKIEYINRWDYYDSRSYDLDFLEENTQDYVIAKSKMYHSYYQKSGLWGIMPEGDFTTTFDCNADITPNFENETDSDGDGISNIYETKLYKTSANNSDTDGDGLNDYDELFVHHTNPLVVDTDNDGLTDFFEIERPDIYENNPLPLIFDEGLVGYWPFKESEGNIISDLSVYENNASFKGGFSPPQWTKGKENNALRFDGADDYVILENSESINSTGNNSTILIWASFDFNTSSSQEIILEKHDGTNGFILTSEIDKQKRIERHIDNEGNIVEVDTLGWKTYASFKLYSYLDTEFSGSYIGCNIYEFGEFNDENDFEEQWHHIAITLSARAAASYDNVYDANIFVNGNMCDNDWNGGELYNADTAIVNSTIIVGNLENAKIDAGFLTENAADVKAFSGKVDELAIWNKILTYDEILEFSNENEGPKKFSSNPILQDTDGDGISDFEEINILGSNPLDSYGDLDNDGLTDNIEFFIYDTDVNSNDTDRDGISDFEDHKCFSCNHSGDSNDSDGDGLQDSFEIYGLAEQKLEINALYSNEAESYWSFNEEEGANIYDNKNQQRYAALGVNGPLWVKGIHPVYGSALQFDGIDDKVTMPYSYELWANGTISMWIKPNSLTPNDGFAQVITGGLYDENTRVPTIAITQDGEMLWEIGDSINNVVDVNIENDTWHHIVFTWNSDGNLIENATPTVDKVNVYFDGKIVDYEYETSDSNWKKNYYFQMGAYNYLGQSRSFFNGTIDELSLWGKALNQSEVENLHQTYNIFIEQRLDPNNADTDKDGLNDKDEIFLLGSDPFNPLGDLDNDGVSDNFEFFIYKTNTNSWDTDGDQLSDYDEIYVFKTDPLSNDTDGDGLNDSYESELITKSLLADIHDAHGHGSVEQIAVGKHAIFFRNQASTYLEGGETGNLYFDVPIQSFTTSFELLIGKDINGANWVDIFCGSFEHWNYDFNYRDANKCEYRDGFIVIFDSIAELVYITDNNVGIAAAASIPLRSIVEETSWYNITIDVKIIDEGGNVQTSYDQAIPNAKSGIEIRVYIENVLYLEFSKGFEDSCWNPHNKEYSCGRGMGDTVSFGGRIDNSYGLMGTNLLAIANPRIYTSNYEGKNMHNALLSDSDKDGINDYEEYLIGSDAQNADSDYDGLNDGEEFYIYSTNPLDYDTDNDGVDDASEIKLYGTDPNGNKEPRIFYNGSVNESSLYSWFLISDFYLPDGDLDGVPDVADNCLSYWNPSQYDRDDDGLGDSCDNYNNSSSSSSSSGGSSSSSSDCDALMYYDEANDVFYLYDPCTGQMVIV
ncbi:MAG TPA: hypothetical protein DCL76_00105 [Chloroflexi bacterium]|nr:hypothetical protein [Chloroflexota bacterium]|tara:strand:- start:229 stop:4599 length:4371 start_codon:yes stop_codon:yes gene_type:complete